MAREKADARGGPGPAESGVWSGAPGPAGALVLPMCADGRATSHREGKASQVSSQSRGQPSVPGQGEHVVSGRDSLAVPLPRRVRGSGRPAAAEGGRGLSDAAARVEAELGRGSLAGRLLPRPHEGPAQAQGELPAGAVSQARMLFC